MRHAHHAPTDIRSHLWTLFWLARSAPGLIVEDGLRKMVEFIRKKGPRKFDYHLPLEIEQGAPATWRDKLL